MSPGRTLALAAFIAVVVAAVVASAVTTYLLVTLRDALPARGSSVSESRTTPSQPASPAALGEDVAGEIPGTGGAARIYVFQIPDDAVQVDVALRGAADDLELRAVCDDTAPERSSDWTWVSHEEGEPPKLSVTRHADSDLCPGPFLVEVRSAHGSSRRHEPHAFKLRADVTRMAAPRAVLPGQTIDAATGTETGHRCDFVVDVPAGATALRIDIVDAERDLDLFASSSGPAIDSDAAQWSEASGLGRESLLLEADDDPPLPAGGKLWFSVVDPSIYDAPVGFRMIVTAGADPPAEALAIPALPIPADPRGLAVASVVEIIVSDGGGSGTIVSADGLVLTARHVIDDRTGEGGDITIAIDLDPTRIPHDLFHAKVVHSDKGLDAALLRITSGLHGQALPKGYRFPACPLAPDLPRLGDDLVTVGFPQPAGTGTRVPVMYSKGVVAGFERDKSGLRIKTDAFVAAGSSGGAALDAQFRLVGVPLFTIEETGGQTQTGYLVPVTELPRAWRDLIGK